MNTVWGICVAILVAGPWLVAPRAAQAQGYLGDSRGDVVKNPYNLCWRTGYWTPALANADCDPELVPKPRVAPAPTPPTVPAAPVEPPPPPVAVPPPSPPVAKPKRCDATITMRTDESFAFDKATLASPAARTRLENEVRSRLAACAVLEAVIIEGHSDRLGSQEYNQKLSERRAEAAKAVIVSMGVPADKIETLGMGKTLPVKSCPDSQYRTRQALIECLAPNRRIVITIRGVGN